MNDRTTVPFYFGPAKRALFGWYHPASRKVSRGAGIVLCNPIGDDYLRAHRTLRHLAEKLAEAGFAVLRFDFHGTGDSTGNESDAGRVATWLDDIDLAIETLRVRSSVATVSLAGLRLGATLAMAAAARRNDVDSLMLWKPFLNGNAFVQESTKMHKMHSMLDPKGFALKPPGGTKNGAEALGFFISHSTMEELRNLDLLAIDTLPAISTLLISPNQGPGETALLNHLRQLGTTCDFQALTHKFLLMIPHHSTLPTDELTAITLWLSAQHPAVSPDSQSENIEPVERGDLRETPILFGPEQSLFGILASPPAAKAASDLPAIIMLNAGTTHRIGPHRFYVRMARKWTELGFQVFRLDLTGIGDSIVEKGTTENVCYPRRGFDDVRSSMELLTHRVAANRFIIVGLCSGADLAFQTGLNDPRVVGTVIMNPRTFCVHDLEKVEMYDRANYFRKSIFKAKSWAKLLRGEIDVAEKIRTVIPGISDLIRRKVDETRKKFKRLLLPAQLATTKSRTVPECLRSMAASGVDTLLIVSEHDPGVDYVDIQYGADMQALVGVKGFRRANFKGTDHTFTSLYAQELVLETVTEHITRESCYFSIPATVA